MTIGERLKTTNFQSPVHKSWLTLWTAASHLKAAHEPVFAKYGLSIEQYNILRILRGSHDAGGCSCGEISERMLDRSPDITRRIDKLTEMGLTNREKSKEDRRVVIVCITDKGLEILKKIDPEIKQLESIIGSKYGDTDAKELTRLCEKLLDSL